MREEITVLKGNLASGCGRTPRAVFGAGDLTGGRNFIAGANQGHFVLEDSLVLRVIAVGGIGQRRRAGLARA